MSFLSEETTSGSVVASAFWLAVSSPKLFSNSSRSQKREIKTRRTLLKAGRALRRGEGKRVILFSLLASNRILPKAVWFSGKK